MAARDTSPASISSTPSCIAVDTDKHATSRSSLSASPPTSTPPTSLGDEHSVLSDTTKMEIHVEAQIDDAVPPTPTNTESTPQPSTSAAPPSEGKRSFRSSRKSVTTYNVQILAGTAIHTPTKYLEKHHKNVLHGPIDSVVKTNTGTPPKKRASKADLGQQFDDPAEEQLAVEAAQAAQRRKSSRNDLRRDAIRNLTTAVGEAVTQRGPGILSGVKNKVQNALRGGAAASKVSQRPVAKAIGKRARASKAVESEEEASEEEGDGEREYLERKSKKWLQQGLFVGQHREFDARFSESQNRIRRKAKKTKENEALPLPMFAGERMLSGDFRRDFKLPFDTYHPLPRKVKVDGWVKLQKNRFIGDASALWKHDKQDTSTCYCEEEDGCGETCHNRVMAYECDSTNCRLKPDQCQNRPFAQLKRRAKGNGYDYGVEVAETEDRGYGVRAMRTFEPHQIIVEYAGEIITQDECERRMKQVYKKDKCYYLMSFDNKMIIDATRGTIARFVNHSCEPNCEMIKWTVSGEPRMALFAGSRGIMTGEELTYDYNFDPFSSKNIQECRCGTRSCRGVLGPKPKHQPREEKSMVSALVAGTKRKIQEVFGSGRGSSSAPSSPKKRRVEMVTAAMTKAKNALAEKQSARDSADKHAVEQATQAASREHRALRRSTSMILSSRRSKVRKVTRHSLPTSKVSRQTTFSIKRKAPKPLSRPGALKSVKSLSSMLKRNTPVAKGKKQLLGSDRALQTPENKEETPESEGSDASPNITPASLRSANKKLTQSKLPFKPVKLDYASSSRATETYEVPDSDEEDAQEEFGTLSKPTKRGPKSPKAHKAAAGMKNTLTRSIRGTKRAVGVAKAMREGGRKSTIRVITGIED